MTVTLGPQTRRDDRIAPFLAHATTTSPKRLLIDGEWVPAASGETFGLTILRPENTSPSSPAPASRTSTTPWPRPAAR